MRMLSPWLILFVCGHTLAAGDDTPRIMQMAIASADFKLLEACLEAGLPVDGFSERERPINKERHWSSLALATAWGQPKVVKWLLEHGASREIEIDAGRTAFDLAVEMGSEAMQKLLLAPDARRKSPHSIKDEAGLLAQAGETRPQEQA